MDTAPSNNEASSGTSALDDGLERMFRVTKTDHPDLVGGIVWADCELRWINERITLAVLAEREACAMEADRQGDDEPYGHAKFRCAQIAAEIRARSNGGVQAPCAPLAQGPRGSQS